MCLKAGLHRLMATSTRLAVCTVASCFVLTTRTSRTTLAPQNTQRMWRTERPTRPTILTLSRRNPRTGARWHGHDCFIRRSPVDLVGETAADIVSIVTGFDDFDLLCKLP